jgi:uncharacterized coiled-coil DUF342 family protein
MADDAIARLRAERDELIHEVVAVQRERDEANGRAARLERELAATKDPRYRLPTDPEERGVRSRGARTASQESS